MRSRTPRLLGIAVFLAALSLWHGIATFEIVDPSLIPSPSSVYQSLLRRIGDGTLWRHVSVSIIRVAKGFSIAAVAGGLIGAFLGLSKPLRDAFGPLLDFLRQIPPIAWIPVFILWFGLGEGSKLSVLVYAAFFPVFLNTQAAIASLEKEYFELAEVLRLSRLERLKAVVVPGSIGPVFVGLRLALSNSWRALVAAEMLAASSGLGYMISMSRVLIRSSDMFLGILLVGLLGLLTDRLSLILQKRVSPWMEERR